MYVIGAILIVAFPFAIGAALALTSLPELWGYVAAIGVWGLLLAGVAFWALTSRQG